jgi:predicted nuclease with TOPRIM domain
MATLALYERILALVKPHELHDSCNGVLQEEYAAVDKAVDEVAAAFAKVEEVRDAVKQLEQGKPSAGRSESLMETMDFTMEMQNSLKKRLEAVAADMKVVRRLGGLVVGWEER